MATTSARGRGRKVALALPVLLAIWLPSPPPAAAVAGGGGVLSGASPPVPLAEAPSFEGTVAGARPCATIKDAGAKWASASGAAFSLIAPRAADAVLPAIRIAFPGLPGLPNRSRAPPGA